MPAVGTPTPHEAAELHVTGVARYVDDLPEPPGTLVGFVVTSPYAHARIVRKEAGAAAAMPGVRAVLFAEDVPGDNLIGPIVHDEPLLAVDEVNCVGQSVAFIVADDLASARAAAAHVEVEYEELPAILTIEAAIAEGSFLTAPHRMKRGDVDKALASAATVVRASAVSGGQDHFYLETQCALAIPDDRGDQLVYSSTQHPTEIQKLCASVLGYGAHRVVCEVTRLGGGFGGKESQASQWACLASVGAFHTGRPVKVRLDRDQDMRQTGNRHPFRSEYAAGFDEDGQIVAFDVKIFSDGGFSLDLSGAILDRAMFHLDNAYFIPNLRFEGRSCRTNLPSNTAFRGFGGPQGMIVVEDAINRYCERTGRDPAKVRALNFYGDAPRHRTPYGQEVPDPRIERLAEDLLVECGYDARRREIEAFNQTSRWVKRGIGLQPVKFGISFTNAILNQAGALVLVYADGSVQVTHGGTEMGQGLTTKMTAVAADTLGVPVASIRHVATRTDKVPNTSATAASSGSDLNGQAVKDAATQIRERMRPIAAELLGCDGADVVFAGGVARGPDREVPFTTVAKTCWIRQIQLHAAGFYRTPGIAYDHQTGTGTPFFYYAYGAAVVEVELNGLTGEHRLRRVDVLHDVGDSLSPAIDRGQVEGAFVQGYGWLTMEEVIYDGKGRLLTHGPSTYKIPAVGDVPRDFRVRLLERARQEGTIHGSKAVGEPPFMLAIGAVTALRQAVLAFGPGREVELSLPATPEALLRAVTSQRERT
jgi:xanthine dehydrogenase large subunit